MRFVCLIILLFSSYLSAETLYPFNIEQQAADKALTLFAQQTNTTLLFPIELAELETANSLHGSYSLELGIIKLLEGTGLYPVSEANGNISIKAIKFITSTQPNIDLQANKPSKVTSSIEKIAVVGSRSTPRSVIDSPVPLDIVSVDEFTRQGASDFNSMLATLIPSFNVNDQPINDASMLVRPSNLRGLAADHTLVLINGKRRHRSSAITFLGGGLSDGAQGVDLSTISASSIKQIEILRDGAAAQYGSDAIAGVINFVLNDDDEGGNLETRIGSYGQGDGELLQLQSHMGFSLQKQGFAHLSAEYKQQAGTSNSVQRDDALTLIEAGNTAISEPAQIWGIPTIHYDVKLAANLAYQLNEVDEFYTFANVAKRKIEGGFYFRHPHTRKGVFEGQTDDNGVSHLLVADLDGLGQGISCPQVTLLDDNVLDDADYALIADNSTPVGQNCFAFNEVFPGGFTPQFGGVMSDAALVSGLKGHTQTNWSYDISLGLGYSEIDYSISQTVNPSLANLSPTRFSPGLAAQYERNINIDLFKPFVLGADSKLNVAAGMEWRRETYRQKAGDLASYAVGEFAFDPNTGLSQGFSVGSNGFNGYSPKSAGSWQRSNWAFYTDVEMHLSEAFLFGLAVRYENFSDFGDNLSGKISALQALNDIFTLRASLSTGFKAPTVGQSNVVNVTTAYAPQGLEDQATLPPTHPIPVHLGAQPLQAEQSVNMSFGVVSEPSDKLYLTLDYFNIRLKDRISTTSPLYLSFDDIKTLVDAGVSEASNYGSAKFFTNDFDSSTQGLDFVMHYDTHIFDIRTRIIFSYNWTDTQVDNVNLYPQTDTDGTVVMESNLSPQRIQMIEDNLPQHRANFSFEQTFERFSSYFRLNYYSSFYEDHLNAAAGYDIYAGAEITLDVDLSYHLSRGFRVSLGAKNLLDNRADINPYANVAGSLYPTTSPIGLSGGFYYLRGIYDF
ncbi:TonB-dependent receptor plug domain-containing protein [Paraglaciecola hydrolytica]|uniref:TonB-dependent receptor n=1 Tax=Paraglaciecola hydrolytica TaxID=1799789 RepID=A0A136A5B7_9ALTE|nr:TonB-dependent receptor [Paraglaciecola hydrolytica]KXI30411.1 TonB-dependent receptor [Paraglaciecola hydrolytica]